MNTQGILANHSFDWSPFRRRADIFWWGYLGVGSYWVTLTLQIPIFFFFFRPWLHWSFNLRYRSSRWNSLRWTQKFFLWSWKGFCWIPRPRCPCTASWTAPTEWLVLHQLSRGLLTNISWGRLRLRKGGCYHYGWSSALSSSQRTSQLFLDPLQLQMLLFEIRGWPNFPCVVGRSLYAGRNPAHHSARWGTFPGNPSRPCATFFGGMMVQ